MNDTMQGRDFYFRRRYEDNGKVTPVLHARVWDRERFHEAEIERGRAVKKEEDRYTVILASEAEYKQEHKK